MDDIAIWDRAITSEEIQSAMSGLIGDEDNLVGYWKFDAGADTIAYDHSGSLNHGDLNGAAWIEMSLGCSDPYAGNYDPDATHDNGSCTDYPDYGEYDLSFDGEDDYVLVTDEPSLNPTDNITFSAWINQSSFPSSWNQIIMKYESPQVAGYEIYVNGNGMPRVGMALDGVKTSVDANTAVQAQSWYHVAGTYDGTEIKLYINGELDNSVSATGNISVSVDDLTFGESNSVIID